METINADKLKQMIDNKEDFVLVEVLSGESYNQWHIPTAINIPFDDLKDYLKRLPKDKLIVVYCASLECPLSSRAYEFLKKKGFEVLDYKAGKEGWTDKKYPLEH